MISPKLCPSCGSDKVDCKRKIIIHFEVGDDKVKVWAFCRNCGQRGFSSVGRYSIEEGKEAAIRLWNEL